MPPSGKWEVAAYCEGLVALKGLVQVVRKVDNATHKGPGLDSQGHTI